MKKRLFFEWIFDAKSHQKIDGIHETIFGQLLWFLEHFLMHFGLQKCVAKVRRKCLGPQRLPQRLPEAPLWVAGASILGYVGALGLPKWSQNPSKINKKSGNFLDRFLDAILFQNGP